MATNIKTLTESNGDILLPRTSGSAVTIGDGSNTLETKLSNIDSVLSTKVDKVSGKQLSTNDYTTPEKNKVTNLPLNTNTEISTISSQLAEIEQKVDVTIPAQLNDMTQDFSAQLADIETIQLPAKADKAQEPWKTATLLNGATGTLRYRKNQFGNVEIYVDVNVGLSTAGTIIAELMIGYRPQLYHPVFRAMNVTTGAAIDIRITNTGNIQLMSGVSAGNKVSFVAYFITLG